MPTPLVSFFAMGGYAAYVWPAYGVFFIVLGADWLTPVLQRRRVLKAVRRRLARAPSRERSSARLPPTAR